MIREHENRNGLAQHSPSTKVLCLIYRTYDVTENAEENKMMIDHLVVKPRKAYKRHCGTFAFSLVIAA